MKIKNQLILSPGVNPNKVAYAKEGIDELKLPSVLPLLDEKKKLIGSAKNFVRKRHKIYCDLEWEKIDFNNKGVAVTLMVEDVKQEGKHIVANGLDLIELSIVPNFFKKYALKPSKDK